MKNLLLLTAAVAVVSFGAPARAQQLDLATVTCKDFVKSDQQTIALILMWLEGYYNEDEKKAIVDFGKMKTDGQKLGDYCGKNPGHSLITASEEVLKQ
jgi:acid stress chaperone HdeB